MRYGHIKQGWYQGLVCSIELTNRITHLDLIQAGIMPSGFGLYYDTNHLTICVPLLAYWNVTDAEIYWDNLNERLDRALGNT